MYWTIMELGKEELMKSMTKGYLGIESSQCQVFFPGLPDVEVEGFYIFLGPSNHHCIPQHSTVPDLQGCWDLIPAPA